MEAAQVDSSVVKDGPKEAAAVMSVKDIAGSLPSTERDVVATALETNPELYKRILELDQNELEQLEQELQSKQTETGTETPPEPSSEPTTAPAETQKTEQKPKPDLDEEITIKVKAKDLGTYYSKDRTPQEAIVELVKGKKNADDRIRYLKEDQLPAIERTAQTLAQENRQLKADLEALKTKKPDIPEKPQPVVEDVEIPEDIDFFDPEQQKTVVDSLKKVKAANEALKAQIETLKTTPPPAQPAPQPEPQARNNEAENEFNAIRMLQRNPDTEGIFATTVDVALVEKQNVEFMENLAKMAGLPGIFDKSGNVIPASANVVTLYYDTNSPEGQKIRQSADAAQIKPPADLPALNRVYAVRDLRQKYYRPNPITGKVEPIPYEEAHRLARSMTPELFAHKTPSEIRNGEREAIARAVETRKQFAPDPKSASSSELIDKSILTDVEFYRLMKKSSKEYTEHEASSLRKFLKDKGEMSEDEINQYFNTGG